MYHAQSHHIEKHPAWNDAVKQAVRLASKAGISNSADAVILYNQETNAIAVRECPTAIEKPWHAVAYAQRWNDNEIQLRGPGSAESNWFPAK